MSEVFEKYFQSVYAEGWERLRGSLLQSESQVAFSPSQRTSLGDVLMNPKDFSPELNLSSQRSESGEIRNYILDPASLAPVFSLDLNVNHSVCDLCAAPGGKTLAILSILENSGRLISIDSSKDRMIRLKKVIQQYASQEQREISSTEFRDGQKLGFFYKDFFDRILVDAPCSSERHLLHQEKYLKSWTPKKSKMLSQKQYTLLCAALLAAKSGGKIVYSTCSINPTENDKVVERFLKKKSDAIMLDEFEFSFLGAQKTNFGYMIYPHCSGYGPIYFCRFTKK